MEKLTGRTGYRVYTRLFRKPLIIAQVEYEYECDRSEITDAYEDIIKGKAWRDAKLEDFTVAFATGGRISG